MHHRTGLIIAMPLLAFVIALVVLRPQIPGLPSVEEEPLGPRLIQGFQTISAFDFEGFIQVHGIDFPNAYHPPLPGAGPEMGPHSLLLVESGTALAIELERQGHAEKADEVQLYVLDRFFRHELEEGSDLVTMVE